MSTWIGIPFLSAFLFVMGGILVGHLLWYRDRSRDVKAVKDSASKYAKAKATARSRKHQFVSLQSDVKTLEATREELLGDNAQLRQLLKEQRLLQQESETELGRMQSEHTRFELAARDAEQARDEANQSIRTAHDEIEALRKALDESESRFIDSTNKMRELAQIAEQAGHDIEKRQQLHEQLEQDKAVLQDQVDETRDQLTSTNDQLNAKDEQLIATNEQLAATNERMTVVVQELSVLKEQHTSLQNQYEQLDANYQRVCQELEDAQADLDELTQTGEAMTQRLADAISQRDAAVLQRDQFAAERESVSNEFDETGQRYAELQKEYEHLRAQHETAIATATRHAEEADTLRSELETKQTEFTLQLETQATEFNSRLGTVENDFTTRLKTQESEYTTQLENKATQCTDLQTSLRDHEVQLQTMRGEHEELLAELDERTERIQEAINGRVTAETELSQTASKVETLESTLAAVTLERDAHEKSLNEIHASTEQLRAEAKQLSAIITGKDETIEQLRTELNTQKDAIVRHRAEIERLNAFRPEFEKLKQTVAERSDESTRLSQQMKSHQQREVELQKEVESRDTQITDMRRSQEQIEFRVNEQSALVKRLNNELKTTQSMLQNAKQHEPRAAEMQTKVNDLTEELKRVSAELNHSLDANAEMQDRMRVLETQLHENAAAMRDLRRKRAHVPVLDSDQDRRAA